MKVCLKSSSCATAAEENTPTLYFSLDVSLSSRFSSISHTKAGTLRMVCTDTVAEDEEDAFPSLPMFVPGSARVGMLFWRLPAKRGQEISHMKGSPVHWEMPKTQDTHTSHHKQTHTNTYIGTGASTHTHTRWRTSRTSRVCETAGESWMLFIHQSFL